jgi:hemerythrin-like domain-containing protein
MPVFAFSPGAPQVLRVERCPGFGGVGRSRAARRGTELAGGRFGRKHQMSKSEKDTPEGLHALLARDHRELNQLFDALLDALQADAREDALRLWSAFDDGLSRHMALEEAHVFPLLRRHDEHEVEGLLREHDQIRATLAELGVGVDLHEIRVQTVSDFIEQLRRHASREAALAYRWVQQHVAPAQQGEMRSALSAARLVRRRVMEAGRKAKSNVTSTH